MRLLKKLTCFITASLLLLSSVSMTAFAQSDVLDKGECGKNVMWTVTADGTLTFSGEGTMYDYQNYFTVPWNPYRTLIKEAVIEEGVTYLGDSAFCGLEYLETVYISSTVNSFGFHALTICPSLDEIILSSANPYFTSDDKGVIFTSDGTTLVYAPGGLTGAYSVPEGVTNIQDHAFYYCMNISELSIPDSVRFIGNNAFSWCKSLKKITLPDTLTYIPDEAFSYCISLTHISLPANIKSVRDDAFNHCLSLEDVSLPDGVTFIGDRAFNYCLKLKSITLPEGLSSIGENAFSWCQSLGEILLPSTLTETGSYAFYRCSSLNNVILPDSLEAVPAGTFGWCSSLTNIHIPENIKYIEENAFYKSGYEIMSKVNSRADSSDNTSFGTSHKDLISAYIRRGIYCESYDFNCDGKLNAADKAFL